MKADRRETVRFLVECAARCADIPSDSLVKLGSHWVNDWRKVVCYVALVDYEVPKAQISDVIGRGVGTVGQNINEVSRTFEHMRPDHTYGRVIAEKVKSLRAAAMPPLVVAAKPIAYLNPEDPF